MVVSATVTKPRWTGRDSVCLGLAVFVLVNVVMCLWIAVMSTSTAHRQASAVFNAVKNASAISFDLRLNNRLHFDGRMVVTSPNASEVIVLRNHRGYRWPVGTSSTNATCLLARNIPPLYTLADTVHTAFWPQHYPDLNVQCKPLQFTFYEEPFAMCAEDWLRARFQMTPVMSNNAEVKATNSVLTIYGKQSTLNLTVLSEFEPAVDTNPPFQKLNSCEYLEAPMTTGEVCSFRLMRCLGLNDKRKCMLLV